MDKYLHEGVEYEAVEQIGQLTLLLKQGERRLLAEKRLFLCTCGALKSIRVAHVVQGRISSCGCIKRKNHVAIGQRSGRLEVINNAAVMVGKSLRAMCRCDCGTEKLVGVFELVNETTKSCGCLVKETAAKLSFRHGGEGTRLYDVWHGMKSRCLDPNTASYHRYGGRGISIRPEWIADFVAFRDWALDSDYTDELQIDRIDVDRNYGPENCRFVSAQINANNRGNNVVLSAFGEAMTMKDWSRDPRCQVSYATLKNRIKRSMFASHEEAITVKVSRRCPTA